MVARVSPRKPATICAQQARHQDAARANLSRSPSPTPCDEPASVVSSAGLIQIFNMKHDQLVHHVFTRLSKGWTPEEIAGRLPLDLPDDPRMRVSHRTLYSWIYGPGRRERQLWQYLPRGHKKGQKRSGRKVRSHRIRWRFRVMTAGEKLKPGPRWGMGNPIASRAVGVLVEYTRV